MSSLDRIAGIGFLVSGGLLFAWGCFSLMATLMGVLMGVVGATSGGDEELIVVSAILLVFYGLWMVVGLLVGSLQLAAGIRLLSNGTKDTLTWVATLAGLAGATTFYCALPSILSFALGLGALLTKEPAE